MSARRRLLVGVALLAAAMYATPPRARAAEGGTVTIVALPIRAQAAGLAVGAGAVWTANARAATVSRLDPQTGQVMATIPMAAPLPPATTCYACYGAIAARGDAVWAAMYAAGRVVARLDPASNTIAQTVDVGVVPSALAVDEDSTLWLVATLDDAVVHVDQQHSGAVTRTAVHLPAGISTGRDAVWVTAWTPGANGQVVRLDRRTGVVLASIPVGRDPGALAVADTDVWVANEADDTLSRVDARTNTVAATLPVVHDPVGVAIGADAVWVVSRGAAQLSPPILSRIDPSRNTVVETTALDGTAPIGLAAGAGSLWVASPNLNEIVRIGPLPSPERAPAADAPPLLPVALGAGTLVVLVASLVRQRSATRGGGRQRVPDGHLLGALLTARGRTAAGSPGGAVDGRAPATAPAGLPPCAPAGLPPGVTRLVSTDHRQAQPAVRTRKHL